MTVCKLRTVVGRCRMKITLMKEGGMAGMPHPHRVFDSTTLPKPAAGELTQLVSAAKAGMNTGKRDAAKARDAMTFTITVEDGSAPTVISQTDMNMSPAFAALLGCLERHFAGK